MTSRLPGIGVVLPATGDWSELHELVRMAEETGVGSVWIPDGFSDGHLEAWSIMSAVAASTERIEVGAYMLNASLRDLVLLAKMTDTLEHVAPGRVRIMLGTGWDRNDYEALETDFPSPDARTARTRRAVEVLKERTGASVEVAGVTDAVMRIVAERADGWALSADALDVFFERTALLRELCAETGRPWEELRLSCTVPCVEGVLERVADLGAHGMNEFRVVLSDRRGDQERLESLVGRIRSRR